MQRVRAGLTGLGIVFLFTLAVSVVFAPAQGTDPVKAPGEPLAQLGVAPSSDKSGMDAARAAADATAAAKETQAAETQAAETRAADAQAADARAGRPAADSARVAPSERPTVAVPDAALSALERDEAAPST